jgi:hypothetical protein
LLPVRIALDRTFGVVAVKIEARTCEACRRPFETSSRKARFCSSSCRGKAHRSGTRLNPAAIVTPLPTSAGGWTKATEKALRDVARLETWQGQAALGVAQRLDESVTDTGSAYAALVREHRASMEKALLGVGAPGSAVQTDRDELAAWRERRRS